MLYHLTLSKSCPSSSHLRRPQCPIDDVSCTKSRLWYIHPLPDCRSPAACVVRWSCVSQWLRPTNARLFHTQSWLPTSRTRSEKSLFTHPLVVYVRRTTFLRPLRIVVTANYSFNPHSSPVARVPGDLNYKINRLSKHRVRRATFPAAAAFSLTYNP